MRLGAVVAALRRLVRVAPPGLDRRNLRELLDLVLHLHQRMIGGDVADRIFRWRQHTRDLRHPLLPRIGAPEVVHPHESALEEVLAERLDLALVERHGADVLHMQVRTLKQRLVGKPHGEVVGPSAVLHADARARQLGQTNREIQISVGIIGAPALSAGFGASTGVDGTAEVETVPEAVGLGIAGRIPAKAAEAALEAAELRSGHTRHHDDKCGRHEDLEFHSTYPRALTVSDRGLTAATSPASGSTARPAS